MNIDFPRKRISMAHEEYLCRIVKYLGPSVQNQPEVCIFECRYGCKMKL